MLKKVMETVSKSGENCFKKSVGNHFKKCDRSCDTLGPLQVYKDFFSSLDIVLQNSAQLS